MLLESVILSHMQIGYVVYEDRYPIEKDILMEMMAFDIRNGA